MEKTIQGSQNWISVAQYAKKHGLTRGKVYMDIYFGRIPKERVKREKVKEVISLLDVPVDKNEGVVNNG